MPNELTLVILENKFEILIGAELVLMSYIKLAIFSQYWNSSGRSFAFKKGVLHAPLLEQSEYDRVHVFEGQECYLTGS